MRSFASANPFYKERAFSSYLTTYLKMPDSRSLLRGAKFCVEFWCLYCMMTYLLGWIRLVVEETEMIREEFGC